MQLDGLPLGFGAEVRDFDIQEGRDAVEIALLRQAYDREGLLIFRSGQEIAPERQAEICGWFGPILPNEATGED